jgi:hypothetical protein
MSPAEVAAWTERTRAEQGLPPTIRDPGVLAQLAVLFDDPDPKRRAGGPSAHRQGTKGGDRARTA